MRTFHPAVGKPAPVPARSDDAYRERQAFYTSRRWRKFASAFLAINPICVWCGRVASMVDHITPRLSSPADAYNPDNCRASCRDCHSAYGAKHAPR